MSELTPEQWVATARHLRDCVSALGSARFMEDHAQ